MGGGQVGALRAENVALRKQVSRFNSRLENILVGALLVCSLNVLFDKCLNR